MTRPAALLAATSALAALLATPAQARDLAHDFTADLASQMPPMGIEPAALSVIDYHLPEQTADLSRISAIPGDLPISGMEGGLDTISQTPTAALQAYGPPDDSYAPDPRWLDPETGGQRLSFASQADAVKWEFGAVMLYYTATNGAKLFDNPEWPHGSTEGWFGLETNNMGVDKLTHAYSAYVISELLHHRLRRKTGDAPGIQYTAAALGFGAMLYTEFWDSIEPTGGWSWEDVTFNGLGAGFSALRNSVPGMAEKLDYRLMIQPQEGRYRLSGKKHFEAQWHFFALKLAGFEGLRETPLRYVELDLGYRAEDFTNPDREAGIRPKRHVFVGVSLNFSEIVRKFAGGSQYGRAAASALEYIQPPYTMLSTNLTD